MEEQIKTLLGEDIDVSVYLSLAQTELLAWVYGKNHTLEEVPDWLKTVCVMAVVTAFNQSGAEGDISQTVDGVKHDFKYESMVSYIHNNAPGYAQLL